MLRSLYSGISGLRSQQAMLDVPGNNIANVNTAGFKSSSVQFEDTLSQLSKGAGAPTGTSGGTNPAQVGLGVQVAGIATNFNQGSAQATGKSTDMMIAGDGFFTVGLRRCCAPTMISPRSRRRCARSCSGRRSTASLS